MPPKASWRKCGTRALKVRGLFARHPQPAKLFAGTVHLVALKLTNTGSGDMGVSDSDLAVALEYLQASSGPIGQYSSQYGAESLAVSPTILPFTADLGGQATYSDATVQGWVGSLKSQFNLPAGDAVAFLNPTGATNSDAPLSGGVLGYHGFAGSGLSYSFVNVTGAGFYLSDPGDLFALALSHEIAEMTVDPAADLSNPEVCDGCAGNCGLEYRAYFSVSGGSSYIGSTPLFPPPYSYSFFVAAVVASSNSSDCPAPSTACMYAPGTTPQVPWWQTLWDAIVSFFRSLFGSKKAKRGDKT